MKARKSVDPSPATAAWTSPPASVERWGLVTARDIMKGNVITVSYSDPLTEVERVLSENRISGAPVTDEMGRIVGVVSLKDLVDRYTEDPDAQPRRGHGFYHLSSEETLDDDFESFEVPEEAEETASDIMTADVYSVKADAGLKEIAETMTRHRIHRVLVEENGKHIGLISTLEVLEALGA
jgi:CBS domain-containing protein